MFFLLVLFQSVAIESKGFETSFPGGDDAQNKFINTMVDIYYPPKAIENATEGIVSVSATVDNFGYLYNLKIANSLSAECDDMALSIIRSMPKRIVPLQHKEDSLFFEQITISIPFFINPNREKIYGMNTEELPEVKMDMQQIGQFIMRRLRYPPQAAEKNIQGRVFVQYVLDATGKAIHPRIVEGVSPEINEEVIRLINIFPLCEPSVFEGVPVSMFVTLPIRFKLQQ